MLEESSENGWTDSEPDGHRVMPLEVKPKSYKKFQLNMSKNVEEKCGKLCISSIRSPKRDITPPKIDVN